MVSTGIQTQLNLAGNHANNVGENFGTLNFSCSAANPRLMRFALKLNF